MSVSRAIAIDGFLSTWQPLSVTHKKGRGGGGDMSLSIDNPYTQHIRTSAPRVIATGDSSFSNFNFFRTRTKGEGGGGALSFYLEET